MTIFKLHLFEVTLTSKSTFLCSPLLDCLFPHWNCYYDDYQRRVFASRSFYIVAKNSKELPAKLNAYARSKSHLTRSDCRTNNGNYFLLFEQGTFKTRKLRAAAFRRMRYQFAIKSILNRHNRLTRHVVWIGCLHHKASKNGVAIVLLW